MLSRSSPISSHSHMETTMIGSKSDNENNVSAKTVENPNPKQPRKHGGRFTTSPKIKISIFLAMAFVTLASGASLLYPKTVFKEETPAISVKELVDIENSTKENTIGTETDQFSEHKNIDSSVFPKSIAYEQSLNPEYLSLLEEVKNLLMKHEDAFLYFDERLSPLDELKPQLETAVTIQTNLAKLLESRMIQLEARVESMERAMTDSKKTISSENAHPSYPPFRLIAIDRWNNEWNAVLEMDGRVTAARPKASLAGWSLLSINPIRHSAKFRKSDGKIVDVKIGDTTTNATDS